jgi:hypothetical protein
MQAVLRRRRHRRKAAQLARMLAQLDTIAAERRPAPRRSVAVALGRSARAA